MALLIGFHVNAWCQQESESDPGIYDRIWDVPVLYKNPESAALQSFSLIGRYHGQYWSVNAQEGDAAGWENRRKIFGFKSTWANDIAVEAQMYLGSDISSIYNGLYVAYLEWSPEQYDFAVSIGRLDYLFTGLERSESSKKIDTIERGLLVNQLMPAEVVGIRVSGQKGRFSYQAGWFSRSIKEEFDDFDSG